MIAIAKEERGLSQDRLIALALSRESAVKSQIADALSILADGFTLDAVERSFLAYDADGLVRSLPWTEFQSSIGSNSEILREVLRESGEKSFASMFPDAQSLGAGFSIVDPAAVNFIASRGALLVTAVTEETRVALRDAVRRAYTEGLGGPRDIARGLRSMVGLDRIQANALANFRAGLAGESGRLSQRAQQKVDTYAKRLLKVRTERIARTELLTAANAGQYQTIGQAIDMGLISRDRARIKWLTAPDDRLCQICQPLEGKTVGYQETFSVTLERPVAGPIVYEATFPPIHVQCLPGDATVSALGVAGTSKRKFKGDMVVIRTRGGKQLAATANHPILTSKGWVPAHLVGEVGDVACGMDGELARGNIHNNDYVESSIEKITSSYRKSFPMFTREVPMTGPEFHGDVANSEVAIVSTNPGLLFGGKSGINKKIKHQVFARSFMALVQEFFLGNADERLFRFLDPSGRLVRCLDLAGSLLFGHLTPFQSFGFASPSGFNSSIAQSQLNHVPRNTEFLRKCVHGLSIDKKLNDLAVGDGYPGVDLDRRLVPMGGVSGLSDKLPDVRLVNPEDFGDVSRSLAGQIHTDNVESVSTIEFVGHVYNLQTEKGYYTANGIIAHNCRCTTTLETF